MKNAKLVNLRLRERLSEIYCEIVDIFLSATYSVTMYFELYYAELSLIYIPIFFTKKSLLGLCKMKTAILFAT